MNVLLVEDDVGTSFAITALLRRLGVNVEVQPTVSSALDALMRLPDVIIIDAPLSDGTGVELLRLVRESGMKSRVAVLLAGDDLLLDAEFAVLSPDGRFQKPLEFEAFGRWLFQASKRKRPGYR